MVSFPLLLARTSGPPELVVQRAVPVSRDLALREPAEIGPLAVSLVLSAVTMKADIPRATPFQTLASPPDYSAETRLGTTLPFAITVAIVRLFSIRFRGFRLSSSRSASKPTAI